jgi:hypothetical protein
MLKPAHIADRKRLDDLRQEFAEAVATQENASALAAGWIIGKIVERKGGGNAPRTRYKVLQCRRGYSGIHLSGVIFRGNGTLGRREFSLGDLGSFEIFEVDNA